MFFNYQQEFLVGLLVPCDLRVIVCCQGKSSLRRVVDRRESLQGRPSSKMVRAISSSVRYQVCLLRTLVAERETFLSTALKESARLWNARSFEAAETSTVAENHASR